MPAAAAHATTSAPIDARGDADQTEVMPLRICCPAGHKLIVPDDRAGKTLRCPRCNVAFDVPGERSQAPKAYLGFRVQQADRESGVGSRESESPVAVVERLPIARPIVESVPIKPKSRPRPPPALMPIAEPVADPVPVPVPPQSAALAAPDPVPEPVMEVVPVEVSQEPVAKAAAPPVCESPPAATVEPPAPPEDVPKAPVIDELRPPIASPPRAAEPEPIAASASATQAITPDRHWLPAVYSLAAALIAAALFGIAPAVWDVVDYVRYYDLVDSPHVARWALVLLLLGVVQIAYAVFLFQLPDWTSVWVVTIYSLGLAGLYALMLGLVLISRQDGLLVGPHGLQLADKVAGGQAALWCLAMTSVSTILAFFAGRLSLQWRRAESLLWHTAH